MKRVKKTITHDARQSPVPAKSLYRMKCVSKGWYRYHPYSVNRKDSDNADFIHHDVQCTTTRSLVGWRFEPTDQELILNYLYNKIYKKPLISDAVIECDLYGEEDVWTKIFQERDGKVFYFFTKLRNMTDKDSHMSRCIRSGSWTYQKEEKIYSYYADKKEHIGFKKTFCFIPKEGFKDTDRWVMHEYRLDGCLIKKTPNNLLDEYVISRVMKEKKRQPRNTITQSMETPTIEFDLGFASLI